MNLNRLFNGIWVGIFSILAYRHANDGEWFWFTADILIIVMDLIYISLKDKE